MIKPSPELPQQLSAQVIRREPFVLIVLIVPMDISADDPLGILQEPLSSET